MNVSLHLPSPDELKRLVVATYKEWDRDQAPRLGAALAFYTLLSLAPLLVLLLALAGFVFGDAAAQGQLFEQIRSLVGDRGAEAINEMVKNAGHQGSGITATILGFATLIFGASTVASELKYALNVIWNVDPDPDAGVVDMIQQRSTALGVVLGCGFLLVVSLAVSSAITAAGTWFASMLPVPGAVLQGLNLVLDFAVITGLFAMLFRFLPDVQIEWSDVLLGAAVTAALFSIGKLLIGMYLGRASFGSTYGAAGSLVIVVVWVYYSSQLFFFGAEFTQVYACEHGSDPLHKKPRAVREVQTSPKPVVGLPALPRSTAEGRVSGIAGTLIGAALAASKVFRGFRGK